MARKKKPSGRIGGSVPPVRPNRAVLTGLDEAFRLKEKGQHARAIELLDRINRQHPGQRDVLVLLSECLADTRDWIRQMGVSEELAQRFPDDADINLMLAGAYLQ